MRPLTQPSGVAKPALRGFTLIELLVAITVMALIAILSWRGIDGMVRTQEATRQRADDMLVLQGRLVAGEWLLINGVSSGVGVAALQMAKAIGAKVDEDEFFRAKLLV